MSNLREIQLCELEMLKAFKGICEKHNLTYYLSSGTLLGAVRHRGFIPWDDDIDVEMPAEDYKKFLKIAQKELSPQYFLQTYQTDPGYNFQWAKIRANGTTSMPISCKDWDIHWGICMDIFPIVGIRTSLGGLNLQKRVHSLCHTLLSKDYILATGCESIENNKKLKLIYKIPRCVRITLCRMLEKIVFKKVHGAESVSLVADGLYGILDRKWYQSSDSCQFEDDTFSIPQDYDAVLTALYGDYMTPPPLSQRNGHADLLGSIIFDCKKDFKEYRS